MPPNKNQVAPDETPENEKPDAATAQVKDTNNAPEHQDDVFKPCLYLRPQFRHGENQRGKGEGQQGGGFQGELGEGPGVADLQRCWGCPEQSYTG